MENWTGIISVLSAFLVIVSLVLMFHWRQRKERTKKVEALYQHLRELGIGASLPKKGDGREK